MAFLSLHGVSKSFGSARGKGARTSETHVLAGVDLEIEKGELVAIVGYSGAGKSTLLSILAGLTRPDRGTVSFDGRPLAGPGPKIGVVFQSYSLLPWLTVTGNVMLAVERVFPSWTRERREEHVRAHVAMVGLADASHKKPAELSGGMRQRVAVARALATEPDVLLMDEPFGALDALTRATLQDELARICSSNGRTIVLVTNDVDEALLLGDRIVPLGHGPKATLGPSFSIAMERPRDRRAIANEPLLRRTRAEVFAWLLRSGGRRSNPPEPIVEEEVVAPEPQTRRTSEVCA